MISLALRSQHQEWKATVIRTNQSAFEWIEAVRNIRDNKTYLIDANSWEDWCQKVLGKTAVAVRNCIHYWRKRESRDLITETTAERVSPQKPERKDVLRSDSADKKREGTLIAKQDLSQPTQQVTPPQLPMDAVELTAKLSELYKMVDLLFRETAFAADGRFRRVHTVAQELYSATQGMLALGIESQKDRPKIKARADQGQVVWYCKSLGLPVSDGDWFYDQMLTCGWKRANVAVKDWQALARNWQRLKYFPSQKLASDRVNGHGNRPPEQSLVVKQARALMKEIDRNFPPRQ